MTAAIDRMQHTAYLLDGKGNGTAIDLEQTEHALAAGEALWLHLDYTIEEARCWLVDKSGIDPIILESLIAEDTRPRSFVHGNGLLVILRGVNLNPGAVPEDMV